MHGSNIEAELLAEDVDVDVDVDVVVEAPSASTAFGVAQLAERDPEGHVQFQVVKYSLEDGQIVAAVGVYQPTMFKALAYQYLERAVQGEYLAGTLHDAAAARALRA